MYLYYLLGWKGYVAKNPPKIQVGCLFEHSFYYYPWNLKLTFDTAFELKIK